MVAVNALPLNVAVIVPALKLPDPSLDTNAPTVFALVALLVTVKVIAPDPLYIPEPDRPVPDTPIVRLLRFEPNPTPEMVELTSLLFEIEPANIALVTDPVSPVVTIVPATAGNEIDVVPATAGADIVTVPEVDPGNWTVGVISPFLTTNSLAISFPYPRVN